VIIETFPEHEHGLRMLATAWGTTPDGVALALITQGLRRSLTDEVIQVAADKDRERVKKFLEPK
jgi:hypothetical protein